MRKFIRTPFAIALLIGLLSALSMAAEPLTHVYWNVRFKFGGISAPNSIIVISEQAIVGAEPGNRWTTAQQARLLGIVRRQVPQRVFLEGAIASSGDPIGDAALIAQARQFGDDFAVVVRASGRAVESGNYRVPDNDLLAGSRYVFSAWKTDFLGYADSAPDRVSIDGKDFPTLSADLARTVPKGLTYFTAAEYDPDTIQMIDAQKVLNNNFASGLLTGRTIIIRQPRVGDQSLGYSGHGRVDPLLVDVSAGYGLRKPFSTSLGSTGPLAIAALLLFAVGRAKSRRMRSTWAGLAWLVTLGIPLPMQAIGLTSNPGDAIVMLMVYSAINLWLGWRSRFRHTSTSGLPNLVALAEQPIDPGHDVVVAIIARYEEFLATLPTESHGECAQQIARRLTVGSGSAQIYHGEGGQFAWTEEVRPLETQFDHLEGLRALFAAPLRIGDHTFDTNVHFGLDRNALLDSHTRVNSALASATEALKNGRTTESFEAERLADASWDLSLHSRIDDGLRNGEIWLALQPQWDYRSGGIAGAEALIRWNHPERGPIRPDEFILQAERAGRIDTLTYWVIEQAISAHGALSPGDPLFQMSINLSGQMVDKPSLVSNFAEIVRRRGIDPQRLTVEVTETSGVQNRPAARHNLSQLRAMGFRLSIDDFGTGEASLSYLAELPSDELKLDRRFVSQITTCDRNRKIVSSTIGLAHALGQVVVAEGIEDAATFELLRSMDCDHGQGYWIGRPVPLAELVLRCSESGRAITAALRDC